MRPDHAPIVATNLRVTADFRTQETRRAWERKADEIAELRAVLDAAEADAAECARVVELCKQKAVSV